VFSLGASGAVVIFVAATAAGRASAISKEKLTRLIKTYSTW
jgi:hypothetical protein